MLRDSVARNRRRLTAGDCDHDVGVITTAAVPPDNGPLIETLDVRWADDMRFFIIGLLFVVLSGCSDDSNPQDQNFCIDDPTPEGQFCSTLGELCVVPPPNGDRCTCVKFVWSCSHEAEGHDMSAPTDGGPGDISPAD